VSGYLQRLARSAVHPPEGIRPVLRPLFSAPRPEPEPVGLPLEVETEAGAPEPSRAPRPNGVVTRQSNPLPHAAHQPAPGAHNPRPVDLPPVAPPPEDAPASRDFQPLLEQIAPREALTYAVLPTGDRESTDAAESPEPARPPRHHSQQISPMRMERQTPSGRAPFAPLETDEIQIHIGRIEVTAVPPAAAPAVPRPVRKSLNLDEYLKRSR